MIDPAQLTKQEIKNVQKYVKDGQLKLSTGFFEMFDGHQGPAIVQIHKVEKNGERNVILTLCDGLHISKCFVRVSLLNQLHIDGIMDQFDSYYPIIYVEELTELPMGGLCLKSYEFLCNHEKIQGQNLPDRLPSTDPEPPVPEAPTPIPPIPITARHGAEQFMNRRSPASVRFDDVERERNRNVAHGHNVSSVPTYASEAPPPYATACEQRPHNATPIANKFKIPIAEISPAISGWYTVGVCTAVDSLGTTTSKVQAFNFELTDEYGTTIKIYAYGESAVHLFEWIQLKRCYVVSNAIVQDAYSTNTTRHPFQLQAYRDDVEEEIGQTIKLPPLRLNHLIKLCYAKDHVKDYIDALAVIHRVHSLNTYINKNGTDCFRRDIELMDRSAPGSIVFTLLGRQAIEFDQENIGKVIGIEHALLGVYNGSLKVSGAKRVVIYSLSNDADEAPAEAIHLQSWYRRQQSSIVSLLELTSYIGMLINILVVIDRVKDVERFGNREGHPCKKRDVRVLDHRGSGVLVLWWKQVDFFNSSHEGKAVLIKSVKVENNAGRLALATHDDSLVEFNPNINDEAADFYDWYGANYRNARAQVDRAYGRK